MIRLCAGLFIIALLGALTLANPQPAQAQSMAPPVGVEPESLEISTPEAPVQMRAEDAQRLIEQLGVAVAPAAPLVAPRAAAQNAGGVGHTLPVEARPVVNQSPYFKFRDVTDRAETTPAERPMAERRAAVETYRQSVAKHRGLNR